MENVEEVFKKLNESNQNVLILMAKGMEVAQNVNERGVENDSIHKEKVGV